MEVCCSYQRTCVRCEVRGHEEEGAGCGEVRAAEREGVDEGGGDSGEGGGGKGDV